MLVYFLSARQLDRIKKKRIKILNSAEFTDAVETETPLEDPERKTKLIALKSIETRFVFFRRVLPLMFLFCWAIVAALPFLSYVPVIYVSVFTAGASVLIGIAARPLVENIISGFVLSFFQPIRLGDIVEVDGYYATIEEINLTHTVIRAWDWRRIVVPNNKMVLKEVINYSLRDELLWACVTFHVTPVADIRKVEKIAIEAAKKSSFFHKGEVEDPSFWVMGMNERSILCWLAAWARDPSEGWALKNDIRKSLIENFQKEKIELHAVSIHPNYPGGKEKLEKPDSKVSAVAAEEI